MLRCLAIVLAVLFPTWGHALCNGPSFYDGLTVDQQSDLTRSVLDTPYASGNRWQATKGDTTLTIVGTMHLPDPRHDATFDMVSEHLYTADLLLVEATLEDQTAMQVYMSRNPQIMTIADGPTLPDLLDPALWEAVRTASEARGLPGFMVAKMQPWFLNLTLSLPPCAMAAMAAGEAGLDNLLMEQAALYGIPVAPLEPWENMLDLLMSGTLEEQINALSLSLVDPDIQDSLVVALVDFYFSEQAAMGWFLTDYTRDLVPQVDDETFDGLLADMEQTLLIDRNRSWIPVIEDAARSHNSIFIGFGAAHLFGDQGVLRLLEQNGWAISQM